jgi:hypothetical protein
MTENRVISKRNARLSLAISFLSDLTFILPIWMLFGVDELGLSLTTTTALFMAVWLVSGLLEIPTGALADRLGRKRLFLIGVALLALYPIGYIFELPLLTILVLSLLAGLGSALRSGTVVPLTYASYKLENRSDAEYHNFLSTNNTLLFIARALSGVAGGLLYAYDPHAPYMAILVVYLIIIAVGFFLVEVGERSTSTNRVHISETIKALMSKRLIIMLLGTYIAYQIVGEAIWTAYQPFFKADDLNATQIGTIFSAIAAFSALGAYGTRFIMRKAGVLLIELLVSFSVLITAFLLLVPSVLVHIIAIIPAAFGFGVSLTPIIATVQKYLASKYHSTALSIVSVAQYCTYGFAALYISKAIDLFGANATRHILFIEAMVITVVLAVVYLRHRRNDEIITPEETT